MCIFLFNIIFVHRGNLNDIYFILAELSHKTEDNYFNWTALLKDYFVLFNIDYCYLPVDVDGCAPSSLPLVMFLDVGSDGLGPTFSGVSPTTSNSTSFSRSSLQKKIHMLLNNQVKIKTCLFHKESI